MGYGNMGYGNFGNSGGANFIFYRMDMNRTLEFSGEKKQVRPEDRKERYCYTYPVMNKKGLRFYKPVVHSQPSPVPPQSSSLHHLVVIKASRTFSNSRYAPSARRSSRSASVTRLSVPARCAVPALSPCP